MLSHNQSTNVRWIKPKLIAIRKRKRIYFLLNDNEASSSGDCRLLKFLKTPKLEFFQDWTKIMQTERLADIT